ncbi:MAG: DMT family transporter [Rhodospirillales bacterium]|nr:DMT family transporter [Rhodospirillales bacterium]
MNASSTSQANLYRAILWVFAMLFSFLTMAVAVRELSDTLKPFQIVFLRTIVALSVVVVIVIRAKPGALSFQRAPLQIFRNVIHYGANLTWIIGVGLIPLAQVFALEFTIPIWVAIMAVLFLKEKMTVGKIVATILGFVGVLVVLRPGMVAIEIGSISVLAASVGFAIAFVTGKSLARDNSPLTLLFGMFATQLPVSAIGGIAVWVMPEWADVPWILWIGAMALTAHYSMVRALALADVTLILPIDFLRMPLIAIIGFFLYAEPFSIWIFLGAVLIFAGNYYNIYRERQLMQE